MRTPLAAALAASLLLPVVAAADEARNKQIVAELFDAISRADVAKLDELYAPDFEIWTAGQLPISGTRTRAQALEGMELIDSMFPKGLTFTVTGVTAEGDRVAVEAYSDGVHASGRNYHNEYHFLLVIRDGKIHRFKEYMDTIHAKDVLMAAPGGPGADLLEKP